jgi:hypothetical protein
MSEASTGHQHRARPYEIRVDGRLDPRWAAWFDGLTLVSSTGGTTVISGPVDQAALHGLLRKLRDVGLPLISVTQPNPPSEKPTTEPR